jgi:hypothetical protein
MKKLFNVFRWLIALVLMFVLAVVLVATITTRSVMTMFGDSSHIKQWLSATNVYEKAVEVSVDRLFYTINESLPAEFDPNSNRLDLKNVIDDDETVKQIVDLFSPEFLEESGEAVLDGFFDYLNDDADTVDFAVDVTGVRESAKIIMQNLFIAKLNQLPVCTDRFGVPLEDFELLEADCLYANYTRGDLFEKIGVELTELELFESDIITIDTFSDFNIDDLNHTRDNFRKAKQATTTFVLLALGISLLIIVLIPHKKEAGIYVGIIWILVSGFVMLASIGSRVIFDTAYEKFIEGNLSSDIDLIDEYMYDTVEYAFKDVTGTIRTESLMWLFVGIIIILAAVFGMNYYHDRYGKPDTDDEDDEVSEEKQRTKPKTQEQKGVKRVSDTDAADHRMRVSKHTPTHKKQRRVTRHPLHKTDEA